MGFHSLYLLPSLMEKIHVGLRNQAGGVCTLDNFEEEVTGVVGIIDVIEVAPMLIGDEVAAYGLDSLEEEENRGQGSGGQVPTTLNDC